MRIRLEYTFFILSFLALSCNAQVGVDEGLIIGEWKAYKKELRGGKVETIDGGKEYKAEDHLIFKSNGTIENLRFELSFSYRIDGEYLYINKEKHLIEKLTKDRLVFVQHSDEMPNDPLAFRTYFRRVVDED